MPEIKCPFYSQWKTGESSEIFLGDKTDDDTLGFMVLPRSDERPTTPGLNCGLLTALRRLEDEKIRIGSGETILCGTCGREFVVTRTR
jgi:hypothetical protein